MISVCITGPDGSGKTTQIGRIAQCLERDRGLNVAPVTIWDQMIDPQTKDAALISSPGDVDRYLGTLASLPRALFLYHCLAQAVALAAAREPDVLLHNAHWYKYYATEVAYGADAAQLRQIADTVFAEPSITFYLDISPEEAYRRKTHLSPSGYESGFAAERTKESFIAFQTKAHKALGDLCRERQWIRIDGNESADALTDIILDRVGRDQSAQ